MIDKEIIKIASNTENHGVLDKHTHFSKLKNAICGDEIQSTESGCPGSGAGSGPGAVGLARRTPPTTRRRGAERGVRRGRSEERPRRS